MLASSSSNPDTLYLILKKICVLILILILDTKNINMKSDIILAGVGGQGILSIAATIGMAAVENDLHLKQAEIGFKLLSF